MRKALSALLLCILAFGFILTGAYSVSAQKVLEERLKPECALALKTSKSPLDNDGKYNNIFNINANLPFTPAECAQDKPPAGSKDKYNDQPGTTAIPVKYFPYVLIRVYKFMVSLAFYLFGLGLLILGVTIQSGVFSGDYNYYIKIKKYFSSGIVGLATVLFAYYIVATILWIFNVDNVLDAEILAEVKK